MSHLTFITLLLISLTAVSQKKWDGGGGNNQWANALNWTGNTIPSSADDVVLDNSLLATNYTVMLPATAVSVKTITITPATFRIIELTLPATNTAMPGLVANGPGYGLTINNGGVFRNASGSASGTTVRVFDSIRINNGGRYIHNSASGHSANVQMLATLTGTETGIFELDIPVASSTISISGRTFGKLVLRAAAAGGTCTYTAAGTSRVKIRNTLDIGAGVNFTLNCSDTIFVGGELIQEAGTFNLGNSTRSVVVSIQQSFNQNIGGVITESGTGTQTLLLNGTGLQLMVCKGSILNQVALVKDGTGMVLSKWPASLPYKLVLKNGRLVTTQGLISLQSACIVEADTTSHKAFVDGPLRKDGLTNQSFLFPVGKSGLMRWLQLRNATGNFTVEYFRTDPRAITNNKAVGIDHISTVEYWDITTTGVASAAVKLSIDHPNSGSVTNLASLRVARLINGTWEDAGNSGISGTPGSDGWVSSNAAGGFSASSKSFALASATGLENPLPLSKVTLFAQRDNNRVMRLRWHVKDIIDVRKFELQQSDNGFQFQTFHVAGTLTSDLQLLENRKSYFRLLVHTETKTIYSRIVFCPANSYNDLFLVYDVSGRLVTIAKNREKALVNLPPGTYFIRGKKEALGTKYYKR